ncbi:MAG TPA: FeoB small GTPase domain-containing protein, partial [bacterium]|nr:FeoB small GTPase domain-containing protein [bacterium]
MGHHHSTPGSDTPAALHRSSIALVGNPNVGKSVLFGHLTGSYVNVSNYPGTTVEITRGTYRNGSGAGSGDAGATGDCTLIDTPGINNLIPSSEDELVTRNILLTEHPGHVLQIIDTKNLRRGLLITLQLAEMQIPFSMCLNMMDEAEARGISVDITRLSQLIGVGVTGTVATRRKGIPEIKQMLTSPRRSGLEVTYSQRIEAAVAQIEAALDGERLDSYLSYRSLALMLLGGDESIYPYLQERISPGALDEITAAVRRAQEHYSEPLHNVITRIRLNKAQSLLEEVLSTD